mgnify:CR=1 FL=1
MEGIARQFVNLTDAPAYANAAQAVRDRWNLGTNGVRPLIQPIQEFAFAQFRSQHARMAPYAVYYTVQAKGYFRLPFAAIPMREAGVKILTDQLAGVRLAEMYFNPLGVRDLEEICRNADKVDYSRKVIGVGIDLNDPSLIIEVFYWEKPGTVADATLGHVEVRHNLVSNEETFYYRWSAVGQAKPVCPRDYEPQFQALWDSCVHDAKQAAEQGLILPEMVHSRKRDSTGAFHLAVYLSRRLASPA